MIITLVKRTCEHGRMAVGDIYEYTYKSYPHEEAQRRAFKALTRDYREEHRSDWSVALEPVYVQDQKTQSLEA